MYFLADWAWCVQNGDQSDRVAVSSARDDEHSLLHWTQLRCHLQARLPRRQRTASVLAGSSRYVQKTKGGISRLYSPGGRSNLQLRFNCGVLAPKSPLTQCVIGPHAEVYLPSKFVERFMQAGRMWQTTDRQTDHATDKYVGIGGIAWAGRTISPKYTRLTLRQKLNAAWNSVAGDVLWLACNLD